MNKILYYIIGVGILLSGCTTNFEEYNKDPYGVSDEVLASGGIAEQVANDCGVLLTIVIPLQENLLPQFGIRFCS